MIRDFLELSYTKGSKWRNNAAVREDHGPIKYLLISHLPLNLLHAPSLSQGPGFLQCQMMPGGLRLLPKDSSAVGCQMMALSWCPSQCQRCGWRRLGRDSEVLASLEERQLYQLVSCALPLPRGASPPRASSPLLVLGALPLAASVSPQPQYRGYLESNPSSLG